MRGLSSIFEEIKQEEKAKGIQDFEELIKLGHSSENTFFEFLLKTDKSLEAEKGGIVESFNGNIKIHPKDEAKNIEKEYIKLWGEVISAVNEIFFENNAIKWNIDLDIELDGMIYCDFEVRILHKREVTNV